MSTLAEIRKKLLEQENRSKGNNAGYSDTTLFPFWNADVGTTTTVRYLPDGDDSNVYFWKERQMIKIPFSGIKGGDEHKQVKVTVPCVEMWGDRCPIHDEIRPWFKDSAMEEMAKTYWKKRSFVFQGFVVDSAFKEENPPENPIRRFLFTSEVFNIVKAALMDPDFPEIPTDYEAGTDFKLAKTTKGQYANWTTSSWARRERSLSEAERDAIQTHGLFNLSDFLPKKPSEKELQAIFDMFEASVDGQLYDPERFGEFYRPAGMAGGSSENNNNDDADEETSTKARPSTSKPAPKTVEKSVEKPVDNSSADSTKQSAQDILAAIRNRKASA
jgi:hypothetical protein